MAYEAHVCTSSLVAFTSLWGLHRVAFLEYGDNDSPNILHVSDNMAKETTDPQSRIDMASNRVVVRDFYYLALFSILHTFGPCIIPPSLRSNEIFLSYRRMIA